MQTTACLMKPRQFQLQDSVHPVPQQDEVIIRVQYVGICGSDLHFYETGRIGEVVLQKPFVMGHEFCGIVEDSCGVEGAPPAGTRVALDPAIPCGQCVYCQAGQYNICPQIRFTGFPPYPGALRPWIAMPLECVFPIPGGIPMETGPLLETLAVALHAVELMPPVKGKTCVVVGAGPVGLLTLAVARLQGARVLLAVDPVPERRAMAQAMGAEWSAAPEDEKEILAYLKKETGHGPDLLFEAAGEPVSYRMAMEWTRPGGAVCVIGIYPDGVMPFDFTPARRKELTIQLVRRSLPQNYPTAIQLVAENRLNLLPLATHIFPIAEIATAFELASCKKDGVIKSILKIPW